MANTTIVQIKYEMVKKGKGFDYQVVPSSSSMHARGDLLMAQPEYEELVAAFKKYVVAVEQKVGRVVTDGKLEIHMVERG